MARGGNRIGGLMLAVALAAGASGAGAQQPPAAEPVVRVPNPVLTLDWEKLFETSRWGGRIRADLARESQALAEENERIAADLVTEERSLTERRGTMAADQFRRAAEAFDARATEVRATQKAKAQALNQKFDDAREDFVAAVAPLLDDILALRGAVVVLDRRAIIRGVSDADVTEDLVRLVDNRLGTGP